MNGWQETSIEPNFVGFKYYLEFANSPRMWNALANTTVFTVISVFLELVLGLWIAVLINKQFRGRGIVRAGGAGALGFAHRHRRFDVEIPL